VADPPAADIRVLLGDLELSTIDRDVHRADGDDRTQPRTMRVIAEQGTVTWYAFKISDTRYGIFDTFETDEARQAHLNGEISAALGQVAPDLLASPLEIRTVDIVAVK
jgi:quinol monooxygenase YgiN